MNIKRNIILIALLLISVITAAQTLGEFKESYQGSSSTKQLKKAQKKIYIAQFRTNFEVFKDAVDYKSGNGLLSNGNSTTARLAVALNDINPDEMQRVTDDLYNDFIASLKKQNLEIITTDDVSNIETYKNYELKQGGEILPTQIPGLMTITPSGYSYYVKGVDKNGKQKKASSFFGDGELRINKRVSKELGNILVVKVDLYLMFTDQKQGWSPGGSKVKIVTNLRLVNSQIITSEKKKGIRFKGATNSFPVTSLMTVTDSKGNLYNGGLKKSLEISGVIDKQKIKVSQGQGVRSAATSFSRATPELDKTTRKFQTIPVDSEKYAKAAKMAMSKFLDFHIGGLMYNVNK